jgi:photosystem II stability/assembly factor-like uncharacterized protein
MSQPDSSRIVEELYARPRKVVGAGTAVRFAGTHKRRSAWFQARESWPMREMVVEAAPRTEAADVAVRWVPVGPSNIGGRMTCVVCHPEDPRRLWAGAAGGGVWRSADGGLTWESLWHAEPTLNVGSLGIDPNEPDTIYCGTGEANLSADSHPGVGVLRSQDGGTTWELLAEAASAGIPRRIGALAVDPFSSRHLLLGGVRHRPDLASGLFASTDAGTSWKLVPLLGDSPYFCHTIRFHPRREGVVYVAIEVAGMASGVWRTANGGSTWTHLRQGLPAPDRVHRTSLALAPSDPDVMYAQIAGRDPADPRRFIVLGVFRSEDAGDAWTSIGGQHFADERQMSYNNTIVVHPNNADTVLCGGVDLHRTTNAGRTWKQVTRWNEDRGKPGYAHADHHALLMPEGSPGVVYDMNDGGMDFSQDGGLTWENRSDGLATNMFYDLEVAQSQGNMIAGGAQDNGTLMTEQATPSSYFEFTGGDGGWVIIDPSDALHLFSSAQGMRVFRFRGSDPPGQRFKDVSPPEDQFDMWMAFLAMDPARPQTVFAGSRRVWRTRNDGDLWMPVSGNLDDSDITALEVARGDSNRIYVGTENGGIFRSTNGGDAWSGNLASTVLPGHTITRLQSSAAAADIVYATVANFDSSHLFRSTDGGLTWRDVDQGALPNAPLLSLALPARHPSRVYVCGDAGVFVSDDDGATWADVTGNLPNVMVVDIVYHEADRTLTAATYGRSIWRLQVG